MRHRSAKVRLSRHTSHRLAMMRNLVTSLIEHERVETTLPKARELKRIADRMITLGKEGTLHARRRALRVIRTKDAVSKLFTELATRFKERSGGYTRLYKLGFRQGDAAPMAIVEYLGFALKVVEESPKGKKKAPASKASKKSPPKEEAKEKKVKKTTKAEKPKKTKKKD